MLIKRVRIANFRSIKNADIELGQTTVLIGPNNSGKTAILEAIRIALTRRWGQRGTGFAEYDVHLCDTRPDPKVGDPVTIEVELQENTPAEWPEDLQAELSDIIQIDPVSGKACIILRVSCAWDAGEESYVPRWEFLNVDRSPLVGRSAKATNLQEFFQFLPVFYLEALRDVGDEFSTRSQYWGKLLRTVQIWVLTFAPIISVHYRIEAVDITAMLDAGLNPGWKVMRALCLTKRQSAWRK